MSAVGRFCCKTPKSLGTNFLVKKLRLVPSPINRAPSSLPKSPVSSPPENEVPQISIQKSHQQPRKILACGGKGLLQQNRPVCDMPRCPLHVGYQGRTGLVVLTLRLAALDLHPTAS